MTKVKMLLSGVAALSTVFFAPQVFAHAHLKVATPAADSTVSAPVSALNLNFSEGVEPAFSGVEVKDARGQLVNTGKLAVSPTDKKQLTVPLESGLNSGSYTVGWHVVSVDGHKTKGEYHFLVK